jgi:hypothetical protein
MPHMVVRSNGQRYIVTDENEYKDWTFQNINFGKALPVEGDLAAQDIDNTFST